MSVIITRSLPGLSIQKPAKHKVTRNENIKYLCFFSSLRFTRTQALLNLNLIIYLYLLRICLLGAEFSQAGLVRKSPRTRKQHPNAQGLPLAPSSAQGLPYITQNYRYRIVGVIGFYNFL